MNFAFLLLCWLTWNKQKVFIQPTLDELLLVEVLLEVLCLVHARDEQEADLHIVVHEKVIHITRHVSPSQTTMKKGLRPS